ncbi:early transcribed membrane protein [Plasmodium cynomolgi strain B]|uniref:Early transcribed membrane protein n=1 Tax=Plasmodium cynomolgi (strain B) TaxID=1120755 RepID=K6UTF4_PLACD|nr:early transcribed membrane protein [Plasmodium cynomolgi strain B]GAB65380.1 early transcribed membrane protein [Plasmodium cynomolgi strain B]
MKIAKLFTLFAILPIVCLLGKENADIISPNDELKKEGLDVDKRIQKLLHKRKLLMISIIAASVLAAGGILGGVGYGIMKHRKKERKEMEDEPFTDILDTDHAKKETTPFKTTAHTDYPDMRENIQIPVEEVPQSNVVIEETDGDTGEKLGDSFFDSSFNINVTDSPII